MKKRFFILIIILLVLISVDGIAYTTKHAPDSETLLKEIGEEYGETTLNQIGNNINSIANELGETTTQKQGRNSNEN